MGFEVLDYGCILGAEMGPVWDMQYGNGEWNSHCISLFNHDLHYDVLVLDVDDGCHGLTLWPHERGAKDHAQITGFHQVLVRVRIDTVGSHDNHMTTHTTKILWHHMTTKNSTHDQMTSRVILKIACQVSVM